MSELIAMRQRIKAIQTIKKITEAMRLIALSTQIKLKNSTSYLHTYVHELQQLCERILHTTPTINDSLINPPADNKELVIIIGSQKGMCSTFNQQLFYFFEKNEYANAVFMVIGKKMIELVEKQPYTILQSFSEFSHPKALTIAQLITEHIKQQVPAYSRVTVLFNNLKRGLHALPQQLELIPFKSSEVQQDINEDYYWFQDSHEILQKALYQLLKTRLHSCLLSSLLAEQMARFTSMHRATKNASDLLDSMKINYNKLRQAKITRELTDLSTTN